MNAAQDDSMAECLADGLTGSVAGQLGDLFNSDPAARQEFRNQAELDALLCLRAGRIASPANLARRVRQTVRHRRLRVALELVVAAVIVIGLGLSLVMWASPRHQSREGAQPPSTVTQPTREPDQPKQPDRTKQPGDSKIPNGPQVPPAPAPPGGD